MSLALQAAILIHPSKAGALTPQQRLLWSLNTWSRAEALCCREVVASDIALRSLRVYQENMKQCHVTFATIVLRKILDSIQIARLIITSYPLLPCVKTVCLVLSCFLGGASGGAVHLLRLRGLLKQFARVVDTDLRNTTCATTTKLDAEEFIKICRPCGPKPVTFATFTA